MRAPTWRELVLLVATFAAAAGIGRFQDTAPTGEPVLVYLANETRPSAQGWRNLEVVLGWLRAANDERATEVAESLAADSTAFAAAVDGEVAALEQRPGRLFLATNASLAQNHVLVRAAL